jgi:hypothetical protein
MIDGSCSSNRFLQKYSLSEMRLNHFDSNVVFLMLYDSTSFVVVVKTIEEFYFKLDSSVVF